MLFCCNEFPLCCSFRDHSVHIYESSPAYDDTSTCTCFQRTTFSVTNNPVCKVFFRCICFGVSAAFLFIGFKYRDRCPLEPAIPVFLSVEGGALTLLCVLWTLHGRREPQPSADNSLDSCGILIKIQIIFLVFWTIAGSVWIYAEQENANLLDPGGTDFCEPFVYWVAFGVVTFLYATVVFAACVAACVCLCSHTNSVCVYVHHT
ncbi:transmembrane protein 272-like isoform X2 [Gigantopelta aegis]|uniref:transmembrane protein 272-like isoform X2 n=1 Tax=Gigantopelta aegis TaxID=1735272 RepID=UPI001B888FCF|nr:transmembrane protein 272-like isoform X2 [Gigantopelta aegis]